MINFNKFRKYALMENNQPIQQPEEQQVAQPQQSAPQLPDLINAAQMVNQQSDSKMQSAQEVHAQAQELYQQAQKKMEEADKAREKIQKSEAEAQQIQTQADQVKQTANDQTNAAAMEKQVSQAVLQQVNSQ